MRYSVLSVLPTTWTAHQTERTNDTSPLTDSLDQECLQNRKGITPQLRAKNATTCAFRCFFKKKEHERNDAQLRLPTAKQISTQKALDVWCVEQSQLHEKNFKTFVQTVKKSNTQEHGYGFPVPTTMTKGRVSLIYMFPFCSSTCSHFASILRCPDGNASTGIAAQPGRVKQHSVGQRNMIIVTHVNTDAVVKSKTLMFNAKNRVFGFTERDQNTETQHTHNRQSKKHTTGDDDGRLDLQREWYHPRLAMFSGLASRRRRTMLARFFLSKSPLHGCDPGRRAF